MENFKTLLKEKGLKSTAQRVLMLKTIEEAGHIDVDTLHKKMSELTPSISLNTIYLNLEQLAKEGLITKVSLSSQKNVYETVKEQHIHLPFDHKAQMKLVKEFQKGVTPAKAELGRKLYFEPRLSKSGLISCNTCHNLAIGGTDGVSAAIGHAWTANPHHLNSPTVYNSVFNTTQFWDGRSPHLGDQAKGPMQAMPEMAITPKMAEERISSMPEYVAEFKKAFPKDKNPVTFENIADAIASFEAILVTPSKFDKFLAGDAKALNKDEKEGLKLFIDKGCATCHTGYNVGGGSKQKFPLMGEYKYANMGDFKGDKDGTVKVPTLRNITQTAPYMHNGAIWSLEEAVKTMGELQLGTKLTDAEASKIVTFLKTLEGKKPTIVYPMLPSSTATTPKPDAK